MIRFREGASMSGWTALQTSRVTPASMLMWLTGQRPARARAAIELLRDAREDEAGAAEHRDRARLARDPGAEQDDQREQRGGDRHEEVAPRVGQGRAPPGDHGPDATQQHEDQ